MEEQPLEIILYIAQYLNLRSLVNFSKTCNYYHSALKMLIASLKKELFTPATVICDDNSTKIMFFPGPVIYNKLIPGMPIDGIYFFEEGFYTDNRREVQFFFQHFNKFLKNTKSEFGGQFIATIKTKTKKIRQCEVGILYEGKTICHIGDGKHKYRKLIAFGKTFTKKFWDKY